MARRASSLFAKLAGSEYITDENALDYQRRELLTHWGKHPWNWLSGRDLDGRPIVWTKDERDPDAPVKPFPVHKPHLKLLVEDLFNEPFILMDKSRQMMATWTTVLFIDWWCRFRVGQRWLLSKSTEDEAKEILRDKPRFMHKHLPAWVQAAMPQQDKPEIRCAYPATDSYILAVAANAADREMRGGTASGVLIDEAARQIEFPEIIAAALPMATRIIAITTAELGNRGAIYYKQMLEEVE